MIDRSFTTQGGGYRALLLCCASLAFALTSPLYATTPLNVPSDSLWSRPGGSLSPDAVRALRTPDYIPHRDLREFLGQFQQTCAFLDSMQEHDRESGVFGGLHEGEGDQLWAIVETDNTQEAIRVWCEYADYFGDADEFRPNVEAAWTYCDSFPAWDESAPDEFYAMHNAGWGIIATIGYRRVYGEDRDEYGERCAEHLIDNVPEITPNMQDNLMPLVAGWSAGTLYRFGTEMQNRQYQTEAVRIARQVKNWIESDRNRLNRNEIWALCGGTAMWGVIEALGPEDSTSVEWIPSLLQSMDVIAGRGNWNNSWNIWYAHAWLSAYRLLGDEDYRLYAGTIIDTLLAQDSDDDGGLPATIGDANNRDQSWVSAYTAWMGLRAFFDDIPDVDVALLSVASPNPRRPWPTGTAIPFALRLQQNGAREVVEEILIRPEGSGGWEFESETIELAGWITRLVGLQNQWMTDQPGVNRLRFISHQNDDVDNSNDTLDFELSIRAQGTLILGIAGDFRPGPGGSFRIENIEFPELIPFSEIILPEGDVSRSLPMMASLYRVTFTPPFPFPVVTFDSLRLGADGEVEVAVICRQPPLLLISGEADTTRELYFARSINELDLPFRLWRSSDGELPFYHGFETIIYYTGNSEDISISETDQAMLIGAQRDGIGTLITGQNVAEDFAGTSFLEDFLHARYLTDNTRSRQVLGVEGDEITDGMRLLLIGNQGAGNQSSTDGIAPLGGAVATGLYADRGDTAAIVRWMGENGGRLLFCSFGIEAISGQGGTTSRTHFLQNALAWLGMDLAVERKSIAAQPVTPLLISGFPNPFNNSILLSYPQDKMSIFTVRDATGRLVAYSGGRANGRWLWHGDDREGYPVPGGTYFVSVENLEMQPQALRIILIR